MKLRAIAVGIAVMLPPGEGVGPIDRAALANVAAFIAEHAAQP